MPFAPIVRDIDVDQLIEVMARNTYSSSFMTITYRDPPVAEAPAVVHVDGTMHPQVLRRDQNAEMYEILMRTINTAAAEFSEHKLQHA